MYDYRKMTPEQRVAVVAERKAARKPWHAPPHSTSTSMYMLSGACYEHKPILITVSRLNEFADALLDGVEKALAGTVHVWVVLPNHWHVLADVDISAFGRWIGRLHNGKSTQWNREDGAPGRKVWHAFSDRWIRGDRHYYSSLNYIHGNPAKHGYVADSRAWPWSSLHDYLGQFGREQLAAWWREFPVKDYGKGWDD